VHAARMPGPVILVDLSHGENPGGLDMIMSISPEAYWYVMVSDEAAAQSLPQEIVSKATKILVGGFAGDDFASVKDGVDMIIIGQPTAEFTPDEINAIKDWWTSDHLGRRAIWFAGDSDYPAQGGNLEIAMNANNAVLEALGAKLRHDYVSVEDPESNAGKPYRVVGLIQPDEPVAFLAYGAQKVLMHGPGAVAWVDKNGNWHSLTKEKPDNVYRIVWTTDKARIVEHQPKGPGAPGSLGMAYHVGDTGRFVMLAAEVVNNKDVIIVSGESPYGDYQPMVTYSYYGIPLDGPRFIRNMLLWATGLMGELKSVELINKQVEQATSKVDQKISSVESKISDLDKKVNNIEGKVSSLDQKVSSLDSKVSNLDGKLSSISTTASQAKDKAESASSSASTATALGAIALILSIIAIALPFVKKK
jgi:uncharacterized protein YoxC